MKKLLFIILTITLITTNAFAKVTSDPENSTVLDSATKAITSVMSTSKTSTDDVNAWTQTISNSIKTVCGSLNIAVNDFLKSPGGIFIAGLVFYKIAGADTLGLIQKTVVYIKGLIIQVPMCIIVIATCFFIMHKLYGSHTEYGEITIEKLGFIRYKTTKSNPKTVSNFNWNFFTEISPNEDLKLLILIVLCIIIVISLIAITHAI